MYFQFFWRHCKTVMKWSKKVFSVGQNIVYPMHGAGVVEAIESKEIGGKNHDYYKVRIFNGNINLLVPVESAGGVKMRDVTDCKVANEIVECIEKYKNDSDIPWNKRYKANVDRLKTGDIAEVAGVFIDLIIREKTHGLSTSDRKMFVLTKNILCSELAIALDLSCEQVYDSLLQKI